jgi:hypothetical protein
MSDHYKYSVDFLPSGNVRMNLEGEVTMSAGLKIFETLAADDIKGSPPRPKNSAKGKAKARA